ncbi:Putative adhesion G protein-coupled receptor E4P [Acanthosepion pharaonis]|uniref:Adhesion G protein-coupled receptor E4P n=1 Tax=Acanthosepion pharaonis TaxID=158019 RepID=A0A812E0N4_ACAPH|nr:Putative adhesion G protein-coupled receptor E4P [Sepia pharaonis]
MSSNKSKVWNKLSAEEKVRSASNLLHTVDKATMTLVDAIDKPDVIKRSDENVEAELRVLNVSKIAEPEVTYKPSSGGSFSLPSENLRRISKGKLAKVVFVTYHSIGELMPTTSTRTTKGEKEVVIQSQIISATIADYHGEVLPKPVIFSMKHTKPLPPGVQPLCSFWNMSADPWVFSFLGTIKDAELILPSRVVSLSLSHQNALRIITYVGCAISLVCLFLSWITFMLVPSIRGERNSIHKNLVFCLFAAELLFMVGIHRTDNKLLCSIFAGVLHYLFLAAFSWMLMEAAKILIMIIQVFNSSKSKMIYFYIFGYGFPAVIVGISAAVNLEGYGTDKHCWLSTENYFVWAFNGPVAFILLVNAVVLTYALVTIYKHSGYVIPDDMVGTVAAWAKGALSLEVILGVTWLFGFFFVSHSTLIMAYIFAILNTLQGFFIYCFHCLGNKQVWKEYKKLLGLKEKSGTASSTKTASISRKPTDAATYEMAAPNHKN